MIQVQQLKLPIGHSEKDLIKGAARALRCRENQIFFIEILKKSIDARKKDDIQYVYTLSIEAENEQRILRRSKSAQVQEMKLIRYEFPQPGDKPLKNRPIIVGSGPAGLFCALYLAKAGYRPILLERGRRVEERSRDVERFWKNGILDKESNVQFGEGGAGTFSDGKLNTLVKDPHGRNKEVLKTFVAAGAPEEIIYLNKPHIGTDILKDVVKNIRGQIESMGGEVLFSHQVTDLEIENGELKAVLVNNEKRIETDILVLAIGHSARDTFAMLHEKKIAMEAKSFAVGVRVEHPQTRINKSRYGREEVPELGAADYKLTAKSKNGRGVYTFCMCPGGYVVNASSEEGHLAVNGMSYHARDGKNANSAVIVTVTPEDFPETGVLSGVAFQRDLEKRAWETARGKIPVQTFKDFKQNQKTTEYSYITPETRGETAPANIRQIFPAFITEAIEDGITQFDRKIPGFADDAALLSAVESRTSSPVRIIRNDSFESSLTGLYPCGEGAGYAGGITSAAMDGMKVAEAIAKKYKSCK